MVLLSSLVNSGQAFAEIAKILIVSIGWIGGLATFMYFREKRKQTA
jgi:hypothetical protein